jgi:hypothetical protein
VPQQYISCTTGSTSFSSSLSIFSFLISLHRFFPKEAPPFFAGAAAAFPFLDPGNLLASSAFRLLFMDVDEDTVPVDLKKLQS